MLVGVCVHNCVYAPIVSFENIFENPFNKIDQHYHWRVDFSRAHSVRKKVLQLVQQQQKLDFGRSLVPFFLGMQT